MRTFAGLGIRVPSAGILATEDRRISTESDGFEVLCDPRFVVTVLIVVLAATGVASV